MGGVLFSSGRKLDSALVETEFMFAAVRWVRSRRGVEGGATVPMGWEGLVVDCPLP